MGRRAGGGGACSVEFTAYLTCLDKTQANEEECKTLREALRRSMYAANAGPRANRHVVPINYHLQKFIKSFKRRHGAQHLLCGLGDDAALRYGLSYCDAPTDRRSRAITQSAHVLVVSTPVLLGASW